MTLHMRRLSMLEMAARTMVPAGIAVGVTSPRDNVDPMWPAEEAAIASAQDARQKEFAAGRAAARKALQALGRAPSAVPMGEDRSPVWPRAVVGSISHDSKACIAIVAERDRYRGIGIDIEPALPLEAELFAEICRAEELAWLRQLPFQSRGLVVRRFFSAKEAIYKCQYATSHEIFDFKALSVVFDKQGRFDARLMIDVNGFEKGTIFSGSCHLVGDQIVSLCTLKEGFDLDADYPNSAMG